MSNHRSSVLTEPRNPGIDSIVYFLEDASALGGVRKHVIDSAQEMARRGFQISVVSRYHSEDLLFHGAPTQSIYDPGYQDLVRSTTDARSDESVIAARFRANRRLDQVFGGLRKNTVVIAVQYGCLVDLEHAHLLKESERGFHLVGAYHSSWEYAKDAGYLRLLKRLLQECDRAVFLTAEDCSKFTSDGVTNGISIPNAIRGGTGSSQNSREAACVYVGRLHQEKGVEELLNVWEYARAIGRTLPPLKIYGTGPLEGLLAETISKRALSSAVELCGFTPDPQEVLSRHRLVVSCSPREGFPMMLLEAGSVGTPCVVYDAGPGTREFGSSRGAGVVVPTGDRDKFIRSVVNLSENDTEWKSKSAAAYEAASEYSPDRVYLRWEQLIEDLSGSSSSKSASTEVTRTNKEIMSTQNSPSSSVVKYAIPSAVDFSSSSLIFNFAAELALKDFVAAFLYWDENGALINEKVEELNYSDFLNAPFAYVPESDVYGPDNPMRLALETPAKAARIELQLHQWGRQSDPRRFVSVFLEQKINAGTVSFKLTESE